MQKTQLLRQQLLARPCLKTEVSLQEEVNETHRHHKQAIRHQEQALFTSPPSRAMTTLLDKLLTTTVTPLF